MEIRLKPPVAKISARNQWLYFGLALAALLPFYLVTLQAIPNGAEHYYMIDVGETQIVLNTWGTLHATGYPLYVMASSGLVWLLRGLGVSAVVAPALASLVWGSVALALLYALAARLTGRRLLSAVMVALIGLTRTVWIHLVIAEIYSFGLMLLALLLLLALTSPPDPFSTPREGESLPGRRIYWLALVGGLGVFHHRALLMAAPALLYATWPHLTAFERKTSHQKKRSSLITRYFPILLISLLGFLPYLYLPLRANAGAAWVYGEPGSWAGFWDQFSGREAARFIGAPGSWAGLALNWITVNSVLFTDLTAPGVAVGLVGLIVATRAPSYRRAAISLLISAGTAYGFHSFFYTDILSALILPVIVSLGFGWLFLADAALAAGARYNAFLRYAFLAAVARLLGKAAARALGTGRRFDFATFGVVAFVVSLSVTLIAQNLPFIRELTTNPTGLETIALAKGAPATSTLMLDWGPRHFAVGLARDVLGELPGITLVDHKADFKMLAAEGKLVTPEYTLYNRPVSWWEAQLGAKVYLTAAAPRLVNVRLEPELADGITGQAVRPLEQVVECKPESINLWVAWVTGQAPEQDWSVFVHLLNEQGQIIAQSDQFAPVYGWRPLTTWGAGEVVRDVYPLPRLAEAAAIRYGFYRRLETGVFENVDEFETSVECGG